MSRRSHKNFRKCGGLRSIGSGELSGYDASQHPAGVAVIDEAGTAWISNGTTWDLAQMPDVGEGYAVLTDENGAVLIDENYNVLVEEV